MMLFKNNLNLSNRQFLLYYKSKALYLLHEFISSDDFRFKKLLDSYSISDFTNAIQELTVLNDSIVTQANTKGDLLIRLLEYGDCKVPRLGFVSRINRLVGG